MSVLVRVSVTPRAGRDEFLVCDDGTVQVRVTVPPEGGKANAAVCRVAAEALGVPKSAVRVVRGHSGRHKTLEIEGVDEGSLARRLRPATGEERR